MGKCVSCGANLKPAAARCPSCGAPSASYGREIGELRGRFVRRYVLVAVGLVLGLVALYYARVGTQRAALGRMVTVATDYDSQLASSLRAGMSPKAFVELCRKAEPAISAVAEEADGMKGLPQMRQVGNGLASALRRHASLYGRWGSMVAEESSVNEAGIVADIDELANYYERAGSSIVTFSNAPALQETDQRMLGRFVQVAVAGRVAGPRIARMLADWQETSSELSSATSGLRSALTSVGAYGPEDFGKEGAFRSAYGTVSRLSPMGVDYRTPDRERFEEARTLLTRAIGQISRGSSEVARSLQGGPWSGESDFRSGKDSIEEGLANFERYQEKVAPLASQYKKVGSADEKIEVKLD